jgi:hypothetical protein
MADWKKLKHAQGTAAKVPQEVSAMLGKVDLPALEATASLGSELVGDKAWYSASAPAVTLLLESVARGARRHWALVLAAEVVGADHVRAWLTAPAAAGTPKDVSQALAAQSDLVWRIAGGKNANERAAALVLLAMLPGVDAKGLASIQAIARDDGDEVVRASAVLALGRLGERDEASQSTVRKSTKDGAPVVRGAAALALLRMDPSLRIEDVAAGLDDWLGYRVPDADTGPTILPWFGGMGLVMWGWQHQFLKAPARGLLSLARSRGDTENLRRHALQSGTRSESGVVAQSAGQILLELGGFTRFLEQDKYQRYVALVDELSPGEKALAKELAGTMLVPGAGLGLPAAGVCRQRWIGSAAASALDKVVKYATKKGRGSKPFWRAWLELEQAGVFGDPLPGPIDGAVEGFDRWHALVQFGVSSYGGPFRVMTPEELEGELTRVEPARFLDRIGAVADDLCARFAAAEREGTRMLPTLMASGLLFLPLIRARRAIELRWDLLVFLGDEAPAREVLAALPLARREALLFANTPPEDDENPFLGLDLVVPVVDMAPSERIARRLAKHLAKPEVRKRLADFDTLDVYQKKIKAIAKAR